MARQLRSAAGVLRRLRHVCVFNLDYQLKRRLARLQEENFGFYETAILTPEAVNGKVPTSWVWLDTRLIDRLATLLAGVIVK
jgi:hypothetical protein